MRMYVWQSVFHKFLVGQSDCYEYIPVVICWTFLLLFLVRCPSLDILTVVPHWLFFVGHSDCYSPLIVRFWTFWLLFAIDCPFWGTVWLLFHIDCPLLDILTAVPHWLSFLCTFWLLFPIDCPLLDILTAVPHWLSFAGHSDCYSIPTNYMSSGGKLTN